MARWSRSGIGRMRRRWWRRCGGGVGASGGVGGGGGGGVFLCRRGRRLDCGWRLRNIGTRILWILWVITPCLCSLHLEKLLVRDV